MCVHQVHSVSAILARQIQRVNSLHLSSLIFIHCIDRLMRAMWYELWTMIGPFNLWYLFHGLLGIINVLNLMWSVSILRLIYEKLASGKVKFC